MAEPLLRLDNVTAGYGDAVVLNGVSFDIAEHGSLAVLGRNGVGKSTLMLTIMGFTQVRAGKVFWRGQDISRQPPHWRARNGIGWVAQEREIFPSLSVEENLTVAATAGEWTLDAIYRMFPRLKERQRNMGNQLSGGEQQMLAIGRALIGNPTVLLMDEPSEGLAPVIVEELARAIKRLAAAGELALIVVEQNSRLALSIAPRAVVMDRGRIVYDGDSETLRNDPVMLERFIGVVKG